MRRLGKLVYRALWKTCGTDGLSILIYHRVLSESDVMRPGEISVQDFEWQMRVIGDYFNVLSLPQAIDCLDQGDLPPRSACITFDDGYADNLSVALPILERYGFAATVFVSSGFLAGGQMWNDSIVEAVRVIRPGPLDLRFLGLDEYLVEDGPGRFGAAVEIIRASKYLPVQRRSEIVQHLEQLSGVESQGLMLTHEGLRELRRRGVEIGGHTVSHPILASLREDEARREIVQGKADLEAILGESIKFFAYPNGRKGQDYRLQDVNLVREAGFVAAVTTNWGVSSPETSRFELPRFTPWDKSRAKYLLRMLLNTRKASTSC